jgi:hypothetical protein
MRFWCFSRQHPKNIFNVRAHQHLITTDTTASMPNVNFKNTSASFSGESQALHTCFIPGLRSILQLLLGQHQEMDDC